jgi:hypothetical protein
LAQATTHQPWLLVSQTAGPASATSPEALTITESPEGLDPGVYTGFIDVSHTVGTGPNATSTFYSDAPTLNVSNSAPLDTFHADLQFPDTALTARSPDHQAEFNGEFTPVYRNSVRGMR